MSPAAIQLWSTKTCSTAHASKGAVSPTRPGQNSSPSVRHPTGKSGTKVRHGAASGTYTQWAAVTAIRLERDGITVAVQPLLSCPTALWTTPEPARIPRVSPGPDSGSQSSGVNGSTGCAPLIAAGTTTPVPALPETRDRCPGSAATTATVTNTAAAAAATRLDPMLGIPVSSPLIGVSRQRRLPMQRGSSFSDYLFTTVNAPTSSGWPRPLLAPTDLRVWRLHPGTSGWARSRSRTIPPEQRPA